MANPVGMLRSIDLDDQLGFPAEEVSDEKAEPDLGSELEAVQATVPQPAPEQLLCRSHFTVELADSSQGFGAVDLSHGRAPPPPLPSAIGPPPPPARGGGKGPLVALFRASPALLSSNAAPGALLC